MLTIVVCDAIIDLCEPQNKYNEDRLMMAIWELPLISFKFHPIFW